MYIEYISFFLSTYLRRGDKMSEIFEFKEAVLTIHLPQELDHPQSDRIRKETDRIMSRAYIKKIIFDFENTEFMDSSGIGVVIGRCRNMNYSGGKVVAENMNERIRKIFVVSGLHKLVQMKEGEKK